MYICKKSGAAPLRARSADGETIPPAMLPALETEEMLQRQSQELGAVIAYWLDDEWTPLGSHREIGLAVARIYSELRAPGKEIEVGDVVLGMSQSLMDKNELFIDTFVNAFEVANKCVEVLMLDGGCDVCCVSDSDLEAIARYKVQAASVDDPKI